MGFILRALRRLIDLALVGLLAVAFAGVILGKAVPLTGHPTLVIGGSSMTPAIPLGSAVVLEPVAVDDIDVGDVVSLVTESGRSAVTHRVNRVVQLQDGPWLALKGDANPAEDPTLVPAGAILGRVALAIPSAGFLVAILSTPVGLLLLIGFGGALLGAVAVVEALDAGAMRSRQRVLRKVPVMRPAVETIALAGAWPLPPSPGSPPVRRFATSRRLEVVHLRADREGRWVAAGTTIRDRPGGSPARV